MNIPVDEAAGATARILRSPPQTSRPHRRRGLRAAWTAIRALLRLSAFVLSNLALAAGYFLLLPFSLGNPARKQRLRDWTFRIWARVSLACSGVRVEVRGRPPQGPCFLVANHIVYTDIWLLASQTGAVFVAEAGIAAWPFFGAMARALSIIFVDRLNNRTLPEVNRRMEEAIARGHVIALFPEGRTSTGTRLLPFRSSLLEPAARGRHPVAWAAIAYRTGASDPPASEVVAWPDGVSLAAHASRLLRLDRIEAVLTFGDGELRGSQRKELAAELERRVGTIFSPMA